MLESSSSCAPSCRDDTCEHAEEVEAERAEDSLCSRLHHGGHAHESTDAHAANSPTHSHTPGVLAQRTDRTATDGYVCSCGGYFKTCPCRSDQRTRKRCIPMPSESATPSVQGHFSDPIFHHGVSKYCAKVRLQNRQTQAHFGRRSLSSSGRESMAWPILVALILLFSFIPVALPAIVEDSVLLTPSGVLQMMASWTDSPRTGAT